MSYQIWKYEIAIGDSVEVPMPFGAEVLAVQMQRDVPHLWARVDPTARRVIRRFRIFGTGHEMPGLSWNGQYVGTFQTHNGTLVWHLYEDHP